MPESLACAQRVAESPRMLEKSGIVDAYLVQVGSLTTPALPGPPGAFETRTGNLNS